jgi:hypothetical protein
MSGPELPPDPFGDEENVSEQARLVWRALGDLDADGVMRAVLALDEDDLRALVLLRALYDLAERIEAER